MKIYLAARFSRREQLREIAAELRRLGHVVTSRWLETEFVHRPNENAAAPPEYRQKYALIDLEDVKAADTVVSFTEAEGTPNAGRGGRHVEFGYALALEKAAVVIGHRENLFHEHPAVTFFESHWDWIRTLQETTAWRCSSCGWDCQQSSGTPCGPI